jgi:hypothetical protein
MDDAMEVEQASVNAELTIAMIDGGLILCRVRSGSAPIRGMGYQLAARVS